MHRLAEAIMWEVILTCMDACVCVVLCLCSCGDAGHGKSVESLTHWPWHHRLKVCHLGLIQEVERVCSVSGGGWLGVEVNSWKCNISSWNRASEEQKLCKSDYLSRCKMQSVRLSLRNGFAHVWLFYVTEIEVCLQSGSCCNRLKLSL